MIQVRYMKEIIMYITDWTLADKVFDQYPFKTANTVMNGQLIKVIMDDENAVMIQIHYPELIIKMETI